MQLKMAENSSVLNTLLVSNYTLRTQGLGVVFFVCGYLDKCKLFQDLMFLIVKYTTTKPRHVLTLSGKKKKKSHSLKHSSLSSGWNISYRAQHKAQSGFGPDTEHKSVPGSGVCESSSYWTKSQHDI